MSCSSHCCTSSLILLRFIQRCSPFLHLIFIFLSPLLVFLVLVLVVIIIIIIIIVIVIVIVIIIIMLSLLITLSFFFFMIVVLFCFFFLRLTPPLLQSLHLFSALTCSSASPSFALWRTFRYAWPHQSECKHQSERASTMQFPTLTACCGCCSFQEATNPGVFTSNVRTGLVWTCSIAFARNIHGKRRPPANL